MIPRHLALGLTLGAIVAIYFPMIAKSAQVLGSAPLANVPFFGIAFVSSVIIALADWQTSESSLKSRRFFSAQEL